MDETLKRQRALKSERVRKELGSRYGLSTQGFKYAGIGVKG